MPLPGGAADKLGNRFEMEWTLVCMTDVLGERADAIRLEPPGAEGEGAEFWLKRGSVREYHQAKRQHGQAGRWSVAALNAKAVLPKALRHLRNTDAGFVFVSEHDAVHLRELAEHARSAATATEFEKAFLKNNERSREFQGLRQSWENCSLSEAYEYLKRFHVHTADEHVLRHLVEAQLAPLVDADVAQARNALVELASQSVHHELCAADIWSHLQLRGTHRRVWHNDPRVLAAVDAANDRFMDSVQALAILGRPIPRSEATTAVAALLAPESSQGLVLDGEAGIGKSGLLAQAVDELRQRSIPVLAFRADQLTPAALPRAIGAQVGLPESPVRVLTAIAPNRTSVLVVDQIDAVSDLSGRLPELREPLVQIIEEALAHPQMRVLIGCRSFDLQHDERFRAMVRGASPFTRQRIGPLDGDTVRMVVEQMDIAPSALSPEQLQLFGNPLHLKLLENLAVGEGLDLQFRDAADLFEQYWERRPRLIEKRAGRTIAWVPVIDALVRHMSDEHSLSAPHDVVDEYASDATLLASEGVLLEVARGRYAFFHESFFDYAFARQFARKGKDLVQFLLNDEQRLFRRAQVRQVLRYERGNRAERYRQTLRNLLTHNGVRFHLKVVAIAELGAVPDPTSDETDRALTLLERPSDPLGREMWRAIDESEAWFRALDQRGAIAHFLANGDARMLDMVCWFLRRITSRAPNQVMTLVTPYVDQGEVWHQRLLFIIGGTQLAGNRTLFDMFLRLVAAGALDAPDEATIIGDNGQLSTTELETLQPDWACELIGCWLQRAIAVAAARGVANPLEHTVRPILHDSELRAFVNGAARAAPHAFLQHVLKPMLRIMRATVVDEDDPSKRDRVWGVRFVHDMHDDAMALLAGAETTLATLAREDPVAFSRTAGLLRGQPQETVQFLLIRAYTAAGAELADEAVDYLLESESRLRCGYADASYRATQQLLTAATPHCSEDRLRQLEQTIMRHYHPRERTKEGRSQHGYSQYLLLRHITAGRLSPDARRRLQELERRFGASIFSREPQRPEMQFIRSPISDIAMVHMSDEDWKRAIAKYDRDDLEQDRRDWQVGGPDELARQLEARAVVEPERFARLAVSLPDGTHPAYFEAVLRGTTKGSGALGVLIDLWQRCHALPSRPLGRDICHAIEGFAGLALPPTVLDLVMWYAVEAVDPVNEPAAGSVDEDRVLTAGLNTTRGRAAFVMAKLLFRDESRLEHMLPALVRMVQDPAIAVRSSVAEVLTAALNADRDRAITLFERLCTADDNLLTASTIERFISYATVTHYLRMVPIIERMVGCTIAGVRMVGARQACRAALDLSEAQSLAERCMTGDAELRQGAAQVLAANITTAQFRSFCEMHLKQMFSDESAEVRKAAAECFRFIEPEHLIDYGDLLFAFAASAAFSDARLWLIQALRRYQGGLFDAMIAVCERFLIIANADTGDIRPEWVGEAGTISRLVTRLYAQATDTATRRRCLDLIDGLLGVRAYGIDSALQEVER